MQVHALRQLLAPHAQQGEPCGVHVQLLLLHGSGASRKVFGRQFDSELAERYRLIALDLPGHGASGDAESPAEYGVDGLARTVAEVLEHKGIEHPVVMGWSLGGHVGIELMAQAIAAHVSVTAWSRGEPPKKGVLLGARAYRATQPYFAVGSELIIKATRAFSDETGMGAYDCTIENAAKARILVFEPPDFEAFIRSQKQ